MFSATSKVAKYMVTILKLLNILLQTHTRIKLIKRLQVVYDSVHIRKIIAAMNGDQWNKKACRQQFYSTIQHFSFSAIY